MGDFMVASRMRLKRVLAGLTVATVAGVCLATTTARSADFYQTNFHSLALFRFEGVPLGATAAELKRVLPTARFAYEKTDAQAGVTVYAISDAKTADSACFYFLHDALYQIDIEYKKSRVEALGGAAVILDNLIVALGPPDYADFLRRTWHEPNCRRRADYYVTDDCGLLVVSDTSRAVAADRRLHAARSEPRLDLGFGDRQEQSAAK
jgi:hypothetical protein